MEAIPHPNYTELAPTHDNRIAAELHDIQLLRWDAPVGNAESRMIAVNTDCNRPVPCRRYGESAEKKCGEDVLRYTLVNIIDHDPCHELLKNAHAGLVEHCLDESPHICATHDLCGSGLCHGDSGGPLVLSDKFNEEIEGAETGCGTCEGACLKFDNHVANPAECNKCHKAREECMSGPQ